MMLANGEIRVAPSILSADFGELAEAIGEVSGATDWLHVDVMDGHFVPNLTIGPPVVASLRKHSGAFFDCHLMMTNPGEYLDAFVKAGADLVSVHVEIGGTDELCRELRRLGAKVGLAISPATPIEEVFPYLASIDLLLVMTVVPGFGGQHFMSEMVPKIRAAREAIVTGGHSVSIEVDGGIDEHTAPVCAKAGAQIFVAGSAVFGHERPWEAATRIKQAAEHAA
jgi:ribulose-phosphate 3-epimerase